VIEPAKLRDYLLSSSHPVGRFKAVFFHALGYSADAWQTLEADFLELAHTVEAVVGQVSTYGTKYEMHATLTGPNGRTAAIVAVWIVRSDEDFPRFVTAYPD
jgi:hypothetical protein